MQTDTRTIDGRCYGQMLLSGAAMLAAHMEELNALNVFPVCDGDTGTNMAKTMEGGLAQVDMNTDCGIGVLLGHFAQGVLLSARGNSGVILSQIIAGISEGLELHESVSAKELALAYKNGITKSYAAVRNPTEGTILTVFRESTEYAAANIDEKSTVEDFFRLHILEARRSLAATKELLPVLAEADVVDSGAAGYLYIAEGMYEALTGKVQNLSYRVQESKAAVNIDSFTRDSILEFGYCTEFLLRLTTAKVDPDRFDINQVLTILEEMGGESVVAYKQGDILKVHVHTFTPGEILARMHVFGEFLTVKVENMSLGHSETTPKKKKKNKPFSVVAVTTGEGMSKLFTQMGAEHIISGGQTANPSIEEFLEAFAKCEAENIVVLPNNKNVILAAKQAAQLYEEGKVYVVETKSIMQGYSALSVITPGITDMQALVTGAARAAENVTDIEVTRAVRDALIEGHQIYKDDWMALSGGSVAATAQNPEQAAMDALQSVDMDLAEIITVFAGKQVSHRQAAQLQEQLEDAYPDCEILMHEGGQDIYDYILGVE